MEKYIISCCSAADLSKKHFDKRRIHYLCFPFRLDEQDYLDDLGESIYPEELYRRMLAGEKATTDPIATDTYKAFFEKHLKEGKDILHVSLSSGLSATYQNACEARDVLLPRYPERKIYIVDSLCASAGYGLLVDTLADLRDTGMMVDELFRWAEEKKTRLHHWFFSSDLSFYITGGRISRAVGIAGTVMGICPLLYMNRKGCLTPYENVHTKKTVIKKLVDQMAQHAMNGLDYAGKCYLCHSVCMEDARSVAALVEKTFVNLNGKVQIFPIGVTIGSHTGPGTVALFFFGNERTD